MLKSDVVLPYLRAGGLLRIVELGFVIASSPLMRISSRPESQLRFQAIEKWWHALAAKKTLAALSCGFTVLFLRLALIPVLGIPKPVFHDEFSFLLAADTFAQGSLTNPTHPMWVHLESFHIIQKPTYMSMYPPGGGMVLAFGQILGHPWIGQLLITALMCSAICWMLQAWVSARWALYGGVLAVFSLGILSYWANSYFCASLPALGGALVLGALPRILRQARLRDALWMATGTVILANSRPYEGLIFCIPIAVALLLGLIKQRHFPPGIVFRRVLLPITLVLCISAAGMSYYFWRVTGNPFRMPYQVNRETYAMAPYFLWETPRPEPVYRHALMRDFYVNWELADFEKARDFPGFLRRCGHKALMLWMFYLGPLLTLALLGLPWAVRDRKMRFPVVLAGFLALGFAVETWTTAHYAAPAAGLLYILLVQSARHLRFWQWRHRFLGLSLVRSIPILAAAIIILRVFAILTHTTIEEPWPRGNLQRAAIVDGLEKLRGKSLVIVHYKRDHPVHIDWVYNAADINRAKIVWARDMGDVANQELVRYFSDRELWTVNADDPAPRPLPYVMATSSGENTHVPPLSVLKKNAKTEAP